MANERPSKRDPGKPEQRKLEEMLLYIARRTEGDPSCGKTKLNKIFFYADFEAYRSLGRSISGCTYRKQPYGPVPAELRSAVTAMEERRDCAWATRDYFGRDLEKLVALREPDLQDFTSEEIALIHRVIQSLEKYNATEVSDLSHQFVGWQIAEQGEEIPYETVFVAPAQPLTDDESSWLIEAVEEFREQSLPS